MRPVRLTLQAFGPYPARDVIDFRAAVAAGLFGIYGQTGSGKSTIFSAMTFALFGKPAKEDQDPASVRSDHADPSVQTEVELVFDIGARRFVMLRRPEQMRPKQRGDGETRSPHEAFLFDATGMSLEDIQGEQRGKIIAEKKVGIVDAAVTEMLGYGPEQFRQIVLLPQGRFETFLSANTKDRLGILRDLFDVSLYRNLAAKLKADADSAEREVRLERDLCARRLSAEGFESTDALVAGISEADAQHRVCLEAEGVAADSSKTAASILQRAEAVEAQFKTADDARLALNTLETEKPAYDRLTAQVARAEQARLLMDAEINVATTAEEVQQAEGAHKSAEAESQTAKIAADTAAAALKAENGRAAELDSLRQQVEDLKRHSLTLEKSAAGSGAVAKAETAEREADGKLNTAIELVKTLKGSRALKSETLKTARATESLRGQLTAKMATLRAASAVADSFENATRGVQNAEQTVTTETALRDAATLKARSAHAAYDAAEQRLAQVQALHLASNLGSGAPCPVCGATEHPALATGAIDHAGRDQAFRETKLAWQKADAALRAAEQTLARASSVLEERQTALAALERPDDPALTTHSQVAQTKGLLDALGPETDPASIEAEVDDLSKQIEAQERLRDTLSDALTQLKGQTSAAKAQLQEMLSGVPEALRAQEALAQATEKESLLLAERQTAKAKTEQAATEANAKALATAKDVQASVAAFTLCKEREAKVVALFQSRLQAIGLSKGDYQALKPAILTVEDDRARVADFRQRLAIAESTAKNAIAAVCGQVRPDTSALKAAQSVADEALAEATNLRSGAGYRLDHLKKLRNDLADTLQKLDRAEAASGPVRGLAALLNGDNPQKLDIETFAIGAMFDQVIEAANLRLGPMTTNRYRLERDLEGAGRGRRGLGIQVFDIFTGKARPTTTFSGGETFIAALALALGLADVVESASGKVRLDTIFIDEGFGSLDTENGSGTLDQVLQVLSGLVSQNRAVGLISHVPLVQEAIPNGFYVRKSLTGSHVEERGLV